MLDLDFSVVVIFLLVWTVMVALERLFFRPLGQVIETRENRVRDDSRQLTALLAESEKKTRAIEESLREARRTAAQAKEKLIHQGESARAQLAAQAREETGRMLDQKMAELESGIAAAEAKLQAEVARFSAQIRQALL